MMLPVFIKGHLAFKIDRRELEFIHQNISVFGVAGLPWGQLDPRDHFGRETSVSIRITQPEALAIQGRARIMRESTAVGEHMGLRFELEPDARAKLSALIAKHGFYPTEYLRKYPRIPASSAIQTFPLRAVVYGGDDGALAERSAVFAKSADPLVFDVANLSPNGVLLHTENQSALLIQPGDRLRVLLEPRGWFPMPIRAQGMVCRVSDEMGSSSGNLIRYLGVKFTQLDDVNRTAFMDLLKDILGKIKDRPAGV
jgi:hypothetical protein